MKKVLAVVAHPDDEVLGLGGTLLKHVSEGDEVYVCMVTVADEKKNPAWNKEYREKKLAEQEMVDDFLGVKKRFYLNLPTVELNTLPHGELNKKVTDVVSELKPDMVYTHFEHDLNYDHTLVFRACMIATRPLSKKKIDLICFETVSETEWNNKPFQANHYVVIDEFLDKKIEMFKKYESEVKDFPHPRSPEGLRVLAQKRGMEICEKSAEAFMVIRSYK